MNTYYFEGTARQAGAIGVTHPFNAEVKAENEQAARLKLYDNWEHISCCLSSAWNEKGECIAIAPKVSA